MEAQALELVFRRGVAALLQGDVQVADIFAKLAERALIAVFDGGAIPVGRRVSAGRRNGQGDDEGCRIADQPAPFPGG